MASKSNKILVTYRLSERTRTAIAKLAAEWGCTATAVLERVLPDAAGLPPPEPEAPKPRPKRKRRKRQVQVKPQPKPKPKVRVKAPPPRPEPIVLEPLNKTPAARPKNPALL